MDGGSDMNIESSIREGYLAHLIEAGIIDEDQAQQALDRQFECGKPIGRLALDLHILTVSQVFEILQHQTDEGGLFGEIAIAKGFMTESQLEHLLRTQKELRPAIGTVLADLGFATEEELATQRRIYLAKLEAALV